ncbi:hypothetical protein F4778DRAFT_762722 [Xylariomycetidae sp. FL2044]|nr:hypothetical protein F4778DRAFT_762722 [Xylariomycetidae sp. FL2044]
MFLAARMVWHPTLAFDKGVLGSSVLGTVALHVGHPASPTSCILFRAAHIRSSRVGAFGTHARTLQTSSNGGGK